MDTKGYQGVFSKSARVLSNDPAQAGLRLTVSARIRTFVNIEPKFLRITEVEGNSVKGEVQLTSLAKQPLELKPIEFTLEDKMTYAVQEVKKGLNYKIVFTGKAPADKGYRGHLKLKTGIPENPEITISVSVNVRQPPPVQMEPSSLRITGKVGEEIKGEVVVEAKLAAPMQLEVEHSSLPANIKYTLEENEKGRKFTFRFKGEPSDKPVTYEGALKLKTNYPERPYLRLHVLMFVK